MSLEGTLETISLPDVLALLSVTAKSGELRVESAGGVGSVWLDAGRVAGFAVGGQHSAVDALFALLRLKDGSFKFHAGTEPQNPVEPQEVAPLMEQAEERLLQWPGISAVVPSLSSKLSLEGLVNSEVILSPEQWALVASIGGGRSCRSKYWASVDWASSTAAKRLRSWWTLDWSRSIALTCRPSQ